MLFSKNGKNLSTRILPHLCNQAVARSISIALDLHFAQSISICYKKQTQETYLLEVIKGALCCYVCFELHYSSLRINANKHRRL